jgi:hypothetical protein
MTARSASGPKRTGCHCSNCSVDPELKVEGTLSPGPFSLRLSGTKSYTYYALVACQCESLSLHPHGPTHPAPTPPAP